MTWVPLLLADPSPNLRLLVLRELLGKDVEDVEVCELMQLRCSDPIVANLLQAQESDGSWQPQSLPGNLPGGKLQATAYALARLGYLGFTADDPPVSRAAAYLFEKQSPDGSWSLPETYDAAQGEEDVASMPLQTAFPLAGLVACGLATDPSCEKAYDWLTTQRLEDGSWPTGWKAGNYRGVAGYRRLPHSRWGCRSNTTAVLICLTHHPQRRHSPAARQALDLLLGRETRERFNLGFEVARLIGAQPLGGYLTYFARFDPALILNLCWRIGASLEDERVADLIEFIRSAQGEYGLWETPHSPQTLRWVSFDLLRSLAHIDQNGDWISLEPRTPFSAYPRKHKRF